MKKYIVSITVMLGVLASAAVFAAEVKGDASAASIAKCQATRHELALNGGPVPAASVTACSGEWYPSAENCRAKASATGDNYVAADRKPAGTFTTVACVPARQ